MPTSAGRTPRTHETVNQAAAALLAEYDQLPRGAVAITTIHAAVERLRAATEAERLYNSTRITKYRAKRLTPEQRTAKAERLRARAEAIAGIDA